jgi:hypothetical protein
VSLCTRLASSTDIPLLHAQEIGFVDEQQVGLGARHLNIMTTSYKVSTPNPTVPQAWLTSLT